MKNNWKDDFRKEFISEGYTHPGIESFIESLLAEQKKEFIASEEAYFTGREDGRNEGYNKAKKEMIEEIQSKLSFHKLNQIMSNVDLVTRAEIKVEVRNMIDNIKHHEKEA